MMDFEEAARRALPPAHWGYMATGVDDDLTLKANMEAFKHIGLKPRRLVDVSQDVIVRVEDCALTSSRRNGRRRSSSARSAGSRRSSMKASSRPHGRPERRSIR